MLSQLMSWLATGHQDANLTLKKGGVCYLKADRLYQDHRAALEWLLTPALMVELAN